uniref:nucleoside diphosphate-linked moiety X motif 17-like n=1 Tax=Styela clava TaxID=7725 RepID=UPI0019396348|nr:nucleoside diphosphate-linked moiety X motif 17-like [Styela clava]
MKVFVGRCAVGVLAQRIATLFKSNSAYFAIWGNKMKRSPSLTVHLRRDKAKPATPASFGESIVDVLKNAENVGGDVDNEIFVDCEISDNALVLTGSHHETNISKKILLRRPPFCPIKFLFEEPGLEDLPEDVKTRGVHVGAAVILESSDNSVFITRRSKTMRTFPHVWVPPGGHVDEGESIFEAGIREVEEESGIKIENGNSGSILGLWESSFPPMRHLGLPKRHHIVVYLHFKLSETAANISEKIQLETKEVDACTWLCSCVAEGIVSTDKQFDFPKQTNVYLKQCHSFPNLCVKQMDYIDGILIGDKGETQTGRIISTTPLFMDVGKNEDNERVSTGTKYALKLWLDLLKSRKG